MPDTAQPNGDKDSVLSRKDLLVKAAVLGAGAVSAGAAPGAAKAVSRWAASSPAHGGKITWGLEIDPVNLAPFGINFAGPQLGRAPMYESLLEWDAKLNQRPALAEKWTVVDSKTIDFELRKGVKFHNGKELTAADAKYSFDLQMNPPAPGSIVTTSFLPSIASTEAIGKYTLRMRLTKPDATVFGYLAWNNYSQIVPEGMYQQINPVLQGIGTGPFQLADFTPGSHVDYVRNPHYWKPGHPYPDALTMQVLIDEQAREAALRAGAIDGAMFSPDTANAFAGDSNFQVLKGLTAQFRELQMTIKPGAPKPWYDKRVRQAVNHAINRQAIIDNVYSGFGDYSGHIPPGFGSWPLSRADLRTKYEKFDLVTAKALMRAAGLQKGFSVTLTTFSAPLDFPQIAEVIQSQLKLINIDVNIVTQQLATFAAANGTGSFDWDLTARNIRGDVDGFVAEFNPSSPIYKVWYPAYKDVEVWRLVGDGRITLNQAKRMPMYTELQKLLLTDLVEVPLVTTTKFEVVNKRLNNMYVSFSGAYPGLYTTAWVKA